MLGGMQDRDIVNLLMKQASEKNYEWRQEIAYSPGRVIAKFRPVGPACWPFGHETDGNPDRHERNLPVIAGPQAVCGICHPWADEIVVPSGSVSLDVFSFP